MLARTTFFAIVAAAALSGCATTQSATVEERAFCERMVGDMGVTTTHDHAAMKGQLPNSMNLTHEQCQRILKNTQASQERAPAGQ